MGLDMYLYLKKDEYASSYRGTCEYPHELREIKADLDKRSFTSMTKTTAYKVGYWRKANAIHKWFVDVCGEGVDDCRPCEVGWDNIRELRDMCEEVLADHNKAESTMPTQEGFFFGGVQYDDYYYEELQYTKDLIDKLLKLKLTEDGDWYLEYCASW